MLVDHKTFQAHSIKSSSFIEKIWVFAHQKISWQIFMIFSLIYNIIPCLCKTLGSKMPQNLIPKRKFMLCIN